MGVITAAIFWPRVECGEPDECWPYAGAKNEHGYGVIRVPGELRNEKAHRVALRLSGTPIPAGMDVLHSCDNPPCCNPAHLRPGTHADNMADMFSRGRRIAALGEANGKSRLTSDQVREFKATYRGRRGELKAACARYGVHRGTLRAILNGTTWRHV